MTQLRAMKDQGFLMFEPIQRGVNKISLTPLGEQLVDGHTDATIVYTKAMMVCTPTARSDLRFLIVPDLS